MKTFIKLVAIMLLGSLLTISCKSNADVLKDATKSVNQLSEQMSKASTAEDLQSIALKYEKIVNTVIEKMGDIDDEELLKIEGANDFINATSTFSVLSAEVSAKIAGNMIGDFGNFLDSMSEIISDSDNQDEDNDEDDDDWDWD